MCERYTLTGYYADNDEKGRLIFAFDPDTAASKNLLMRVCGDGFMPFDNKNFYVYKPKSRHIRGIEACLGAKCSVNVLVTRYQFISTADFNKGDTVMGARLTLNSIKNLFD